MDQERQDRVLGLYKEKVAKLPRALRDREYSLSDSKAERGYVRDKVYAKYHGRNAAYYYAKGGLPRGDAKARAGQEVKRRSSTARVESGKPIEHGRPSPHTKDRRTKEVRKQDQARQGSIARTERRTRLLREKNKALDSQISDLQKKWRGGWSYGNAPSKPKPKGRLTAGVRKAFGKLLRKATRTG